MIVVLPDGPAMHDIPVDPPPVPVVTDLWKTIIQPASMAAMAIAAVGAGVLGIIARRNHMAELKEMESQQLVEVSAGEANAGEV